MKNLIKRILYSLGYEVRNLNVEPGSIRRPVGNFKVLLEDLRHRGLTCKTILDVGAHKTSWSRMAKEVYPEANFVLIEPQIEMKEDLERFCEEFKGSVYFLAGAGAEKGTLRLTIWDDSYGSTFALEPDENLKKTRKQREVEIITIDDLINSSKIDNPELIKLDIQGFELEALKGAQKTFGYTEVYILEVSLFQFWSDNTPIFSDVVNFMLERDYVVYDFAGFWRRPLDGALGQCDVCFVKRNGFLRKTQSSG
jgi:FkbM family methyltransferase